MFGAIFGHLARFKSKFERNFVKFVMEHLSVFSVDSY